MEATGIDALVQLGKYGVIGIILALIGLIALVVCLLYKFASNHVRHSNDAFNKNTEALTKLTDVIDMKIK